MRNELDGIRVEFPNGWGLIRSSITEPKITLRFEGESGADLDEVIAAFLAPLPELKQEVFAALRRSAGDGQNADA
jgi:phosphomannomutase/phosphoglucomutase